MTASSQEGTAQPAQKRNNRTFWIMVVLFGLPYLMAWFYFQFREELPSMATSNNGDLISPVRPLKNMEFVDMHGSVFTLEGFQGRWILATVTSSECNEICKKNIYHIRQIRKAMAADRRRIADLLILTDTTGLATLQPILEQEYTELTVGVGPATSIETLLNVLKDPNPMVKNGVYIIDPFGNLMMSYPAGFDPELILKDIRRLLKVSQVG